MWRSWKFVVSIIMFGDMKMVKYMEWLRLWIKFWEGVECIELGFEFLKKYFYLSLYLCKMYEYGWYGKFGMCMFFKLKIKLKFYGGFFLNKFYYVLLIYYCVVFLYLCMYVFWLVFIWSSYFVYWLDCYDEIFIIYLCKCWY